MDDEDDPPKRNTALLIWLAFVALLLGPSLLVWTVRGIGAAAQCAPGPELCHGIALGGGLRDALLLAWSIGSNTLFLVAAALSAAIAGMCARRPLLGASTLLLLPLATLMLPMAAVYSAAYEGCAVNEAGIGDCRLWGVHMGMSFHLAANAPWLIYGFAPYSFSLALMLGIVEWFFARERTRGHATARAHRFPDDRFPR
jgi:hypothetical protein